MKVWSIARCLVVLVAVGALLFPPQQASGQMAGALDPGSVIQGSTSYDGASIYGFEAAAAGVLTIVVRSADGADVFLLVTDSDGQPLPNGRSDLDLGGDAGAEQFAVTLPRAGSYQVRVETYSDTQAPFKIGVSWLSFPDLTVPPDPDGSPGSAASLKDRHLRGSASFGGGERCP